MFYVFSLLIHWYALYNTLFFFPAQPDRKSFICILYSLGSNLGFLSTFHDAMFRRLILQNARDIYRLDWQDGLMWLCQQLLAVFTNESSHKQPTIAEADCSLSSHSDGNKQPEYRERLTQTLLHSCRLHNNILSHLNLRC